MDGYVLNQLLLIPEFVERYKNQLTIFSSRIPGQGYNSMDVQIIKEFLPTYVGPVIVANPLITTKSGTDFDYDKLPTITPELTKKGEWKDSKGNKMIKAAETILLDPLNFNRLVTPNITADIDIVVKNTLEKLGEDVSEPRFDNVFNLVSHLRKWWATKMKDSLGIGATNNTFFTLAQEADLKIKPNFKIGNIPFPTLIPFKKSGQFSDPLVGDRDKLEYVNQFINITVDVASNDKIGYTNLRRENTSLLLFLVENGVSFEDAFYFINQPAIIKYYQQLGFYLDQGMGTGEARRLVITKLLGVTTKIEGKSLDKGIIYNSLLNLIDKEEFSNLLSTIVSKDEIPATLNKTQKQYLAYYLIGLEMAEKMREVQSYNNFDTSPAP
ncbi:MAG: hypothetical protein IPK55_10860, partial [Streptococcus sp.]|nr:hypothetical protein [Streptococcus sp.]